MRKRLQLKSSPARAKQSTRSPLLYIIFFATIAMLFMLPYSLLAVIQIRRTMKQFPLDISDSKQWMKLYHQSTENQEINPLGVFGQSSFATDSSHNDKAPLPQYHSQDYSENNLSTVQTYQETGTPTYVGAKTNTSVKSGTYQVENPVETMTQFLTTIQDVPQSKVQYSMPVPPIEYNRTLSINLQNCCEERDQAREDEQGFIAQHNALYIVGAQKAGTTFLADSLATQRLATFIQCHKRIDGRTNTKENHFFNVLRLGRNSFIYYDEQWRQDTAWTLYKLRQSKQQRIKKFKKSLPQNINSSSLLEEAKRMGVDLDKDVKLTLIDATPNYINSAYTPCRIKRLVPHAKIVILLRDPTERAISRFYMLGNRALTHDPKMYKYLKFSRSLAKELVWLQDHQCLFGADGNTSRQQKSWGECFGCVQIHKNTPGHCFKAQSPQDDDVLGLEGYISAGLYASQIAWWLNYFDPSNLLILFNSDMKKKPIETIERVGRFSGLGAQFKVNMKAIHQQFPNLNEIGLQRDEAVYEHQSKAQSQDMDFCRKFLRRFYQYPNQQLYKLFEEYGIKYTRFEDEWEEADD